MHLLRAHTQQISICVIQKSYRAEMFAGFEYFLSERERKRERERETETETERQRKREREKERETRIKINHRFSVFVGQIRCKVLHHIEK